MFAVFMILASAIYLAHGDANCPSALHTGELRNLQSHKCMDSDNAGSGQVQTYTCDGKADQQIIACNDGTIRNMAKNYCLTPSNTGAGTGDLTFQPCELYPSVPDYQKFKTGGSRSYTDASGIKQTGYEYKNVKSNLCVDVSGAGGQGNIAIYNCQSSDDQFFYFRNRGEVVNSGRLRNQKSGQCATADNTGWNSNIHTTPCTDSRKQYWTHYENGEVVNMASNSCMDPDGSGDSSESVQTYECAEQTDQMWSTPSQYADGNYLAFMSKQTSKCLDVEGNDGTGDIDLYQCQGVPDQRFEWVTEDWVSPTSQWRQISCNLDGAVTYEIDNTVSYTNEVTSQVSVGVELAIEANLIFVDMKASASVAASVAYTWSSTHEQTTKTSFSCDYYENGNPWKGGCMWQLYVTTTDVQKNDLSWDAKIVRCSRGGDAPKCPPFTKCQDEECTKCEDYSTEGKRVEL
ncbi:galactose/N-acetylgalactosamine-binding lectin CEL-III-like [Clytia hemisphaerica]|uniref:Ricin B lectin domain-containing protein n=1 Tax=Clytia hemisphaerica TaxID=252671 RepID=A0A7M5XBA6_9CNID